MRSITWLASTLPTAEALQKCIGTDRNVKREIFREDMLICCNKNRFYFLHISLHVPQNKHELVPDCVEEFELEEIIDHIF